MNFSADYPIFLSLVSNPFIKWLWSLKLVLIDYNSAGCIAFNVRIWIEEGMWNLGVHNLECDLEAYYGIQFSSAGARKCACVSTTLCYLSQTNYALQAETGSFFLRLYLQLRWSLLELIWEPLARNPGCPRFEGDKMNYEIWNICILGFCSHWNWPQIVCSNFVQSALLHSTVLAWIHLSLPRFFSQFHITICS